jgi:prophage DNA circulation protein
MGLLDLILPPGLDKTKDFTTWQRNYLQASFRGVEFFINSATTSGGREIVDHAYPRAELVEHEDNGALDKTFSLSAYVVGDDYYDQRDKLEKALDTYGPGRLIHPYRGTLKVVVADWSSTEQTTEGRVARYSINFKIEEVVSPTSAYKDTRSAVKKAKKNILDKTLDAFEKAYDVAHETVSTIAYAREAIAGGFGLIDAAKRTVGVIAEFQRELDNAKGNVIALSLNAKLLGKTFQDLINFGTDAATTTSFGATAQNSNAQNIEQYQIAENAKNNDAGATATIIAVDEINKLQVRCSIAAITGLTLTTPFSTVEDADEAKSSLFDLIDEQLSDATIPDDLFAALQDAKAAVHNDLSSRIINLPELIDYDNPGATNSLSLTRSLYGDLDNEQDLISRNKIIHPGFLPVGKLQVKINE